MSFFVISGLTGSGKTELLNIMSQNHYIIDLEKLVAHRGSTFGAIQYPQPSTASFENSLALALSRIPAGSLVLVEDESRFIGKCVLPEPFWKEMLIAPRVVIEDSLENRAERIFRDYLDSDSLRDSNKCQYFLECLDRIKDSMGGLAHKSVTEKIKEAFSSSMTDSQLHLAWILELLSSYYDSCYRHSMRKSKKEILFFGSKEEVAEFVMKGKGSKLILQESSDLLKIQ